MAATLDDVALRAGVNKTTVSTVLNGSRSNTRVSEATRGRILEAVEELSYRPNATARGLRRARLDTIGVSLHAMGRLAITNSYCIQVFQGVVQAAHDTDYNVTLVHKPRNNPLKCLDGFRSDLIDGMVIVAPGDEYRMVKQMSSWGVPIVAVSVPSEACGIPTVDVDNDRGTRLAMEHLLGLGHTRIAFMTWTDTPADSVERRSAFISVMGEAGLPVPPEYLAENDQRYIPEYGDPAVLAFPLDSAMPYEFYESSRQLLTMPNRPTAIFTSDDRAARDVLHAARDLGISVPGELSVVGFDDIPEAAHLDPPLTTIRQPLVEMGAAAARILIGILNGEEMVPKTHRFEPELIVRGSTGPAPA